VIEQAVSHRTGRPVTGADLPVRWQGGRTRAIVIVAALVAVIATSIVVLERTEPRPPRPLGSIAGVTVWSTSSDLTNLAEVSFSWLTQWSDGVVTVVVDSPGVGWSDGPLPVSTEVAGWDQDPRCRSYLAPVTFDESTSSISVVRGWLRETPQRDLLLLRGYSCEDSFMFGPEAVSMPLVLPEGPITDRWGNEVPVVRRPEAYPLSLS
jgi:hypothetical protein